MESEISKEKKLVDDFEQAAINLLVELRMGNGLDDQKYKKLVQTLIACANEWEKRDSIPKNAIRPLIELYDELYNFSLNYAEEESTRILEAAKNIKMLIQKCTKVRGEVAQEQTKIIAKLLGHINEGGNFFEKIENGKGINEQQFEKIYDELEFIYNQMYAEESFPNVFVTMLIDFCEIDLFIYQYEEAFNQHEEADKIYEAHERIIALLIG